MKTLYITAGHSTKGPDKGATSKYGTEAVEARKFVNDLAKFLHKNGVYVYTDDDSWNLNQTIAWLGTKVKTPDVTIDIHFNAFNEKSTGVECLIPSGYTDKELSIAKNIAEILSGTLRLPLRGGEKTGIKGVKVETESQHPRLGILSNNNLASAANVLVELCFISNPDDMKSYRDNYDRLVENIGFFLKNL
jgi:N-acetylmuramoyl-L-alanine amidase